MRIFLATMLIALLLITFATGQKMADDQLVESNNRLRAQVSELHERAKLDDKFLKAKDAIIDGYKAQLNEALAMCQEMINDK